MASSQIQLPGVSAITEQLIFKTLWDHLPKRSFISGMWLRDYFNTPLWGNCFMRVLPVNKYPYMRFYFGNIILLAPSERALYEQCTEESLIHYSLEIEERTGGKATANWQAIKDLEKELLAEYHKYFPYTYKGIVDYKYSFAEIEVIVGHLNKNFWESFK
jgi:hypothetical protein